MLVASNHWHRLLWVVCLALPAAGCGESDDAVDRPFIRGWQLDEQQCDQPVAGSRCYQLTLDVFDYDGEAEAACRIYPLDDEGAAYDLDERVAPDLDRQSAEHEVAIIDGFTIRAGDRPVFDVVLPVVEDGSFRRWQATCHPGAPG